VTTRRETCPSVTLNGLKIPQNEDAKYLGLHLDRIGTGENPYSPSENNLEFN